MINIKKLSIIALILLAIGVVGGLFTYPSTIEADATMEEKVIKEEFTTLKVDSDNARVEIIPTKDSAAKIELVTKGYKGSESTFTTEVEGDILSVSFKLKEKWLFRFGFHTQSQHLKIFLPEKQYEDFTIKNGNGEVQIEQMRVNNLQVKIANGEIELDTIMAKRVNVESANGEIYLQGVEGDIIGSTTNGEILVETKDLDRMMQLTTANGEIIVRTEKEPTNTTFDVEVANGDISILDKYEGSTVIGKGKYVVKLRTTNGEITVAK